MLLLHGQCNDAYWHGVFGGLYSPHLRTALWRPLVEAEAIADHLTHRKRNAYAELAKRMDFDGDGSNEEIYFTSDRYAALIKPDDGGTICELDFRPSPCPARDQFFSEEARNIPLVRARHGCSRSPDRSDNS